MPVVGVHKVFDKKFSFLVHIDFFFSAAFSKMSSLEAEVGDIKYSEGGSLIANKSAGRLDFKDVTLERGASTYDRDAMLWFAQVAAAPLLGPFTLEPNYKRNVTVSQLDRNGVPTKMWTLWNAWPKTFVAGEWDNNVDENVIEKLTLCYDYFTRTY